ncbi:MAG: SUMF1/EgtB/PvdO family nonheme iron enzyme [Alphaproteobacteria bacterium]|nr:SUMF1/EgtB/PvdO family nonheme iron enzyme [Alphaproteobacteria bacterium]
MPRLFISHSSKDNIQALAFQRWLMGRGWGQDDIFIDLHDMQAGEKWRETLVKANVACDALLFLASPEALGSDECLREVRRAEDDRKDVIVAILRDVTLEDARLKPWMDRQIVDLSAELREERVEVEHQSRRHFVDFNRLALEAIHAKLIDWGHAPDSFAWPPKERPNAQPYPGLDAFDELSAGVYFGREADIMSGIRDLRQMRHRGSPRLMVIQAASGAGKSSFLRAGLWPKLARTAEFVPLAIVRPAKGVITGPQGLGKGLEDWFGRHRSRRSAGSINAELMAGDTSAGAAKLAAIMREAAQIVEEARSLAAEDGRPSARPSMLIAIDQGEELFAAEDTAESERFITMLGHLLAHPPEGLDPLALMTIRADSVDPLLQRVPKLGIDAPHMRPLPPLSVSAYRDVITKPAAVYARRVARLDVEPELVELLVEKSTGKDALPLLAFTLQRMFDLYHNEQRLTVADYEAMGGIEGSIDRALVESQKIAGAAGSQYNLRRLMVPGLATWDPAANAAKRLVAREGDLTGGDRASLAPLANALVANRLLTRGAGTLEVAHEALLRRPPIDGWLDAQKDALKLRDDVLKEAAEWAGGGKAARDLVRHGDRLKSALHLAANPDFASALSPAKDYLTACRGLETAGQRRARRTQRAITTLMAGVIALLIGIIFKAEIEQVAFEQTTVRNYITAQVRPHVLTAEKERALKPGTTFRECAKDCPEMVVVPSGSFLMGSPDGEKGRYASEGPVHPVTIAKPFAVGKFAVTWDEWEVCVTMRGCDGRPTGDAAYGKLNRPVINVTWDQAQSYAAWLSRMTGKPYRLLTEAEWEYAARGVTSKEAPHLAYPWGDEDICKHANLADKKFKTAGYSGDSADCDDGWSTTAPVGKYPANAFGLHDMHGNVWQWLQDGWHDNYKGDPPSDGTEWVKGADTSRRVVRGGSWINSPQFLRSVDRNRVTTGGRVSGLGFRVGRTLNP